MLQGKYHRHTPPCLPSLPSSPPAAAFPAERAIPEKELSTIQLDNIIKEVDNCRICLKDKETSNWIVSFGDSVQADQHNEVQRAKVSQQTVLKGILPN